MKKLISILSLLLIAFMISCSKPANKSLKLINNSGYNIDSVFVKFAYSKKIVDLKTVIKPKDSLTINSGNYNIKEEFSSNKTVNLFSYFIKGEKYSGSWGLSEGFISDKQDLTIYIFSNGWSTINDSLKVIENITTR